VFKLKAIRSKDRKLGSKFSRGYNVVGLCKVVRLSIGQVAESLREFKVDDGSDKYGSESLPVHKKKRARERDMLLDSNKRECEDLAGKKHTTAHLVLGIKERDRDVAR
jgi:hypothetical protein